MEQNVYFYIFHSLGLTSIYTNVYSEKNDRIPDSGNFDYSLNTHEEIKIPINGIK
jgi:hypothetical protein